MDSTWQQSFFALTIKKVKLCCTLYHWFLQIVAVGGLCVPANECSKGGVPFATGKLSNSSTNNVHPQLGHLQIGFFCSVSHWCPGTLSEDTRTRILSSTFQNNCVFNVTSDQHHQHRSQLQYNKGRCQTALQFKPAECGLVLCAG